MPSGKNHGNCDKFVKSNSGPLTHACGVSGVRAMTDATTDENTSGAKRFMEKFPRTICAANTAPATGALQPAASPAAAPQATRRRRRYGGHFATRPSFEDTAAATCMIKPSRPIDAPVLMLTTDDAALTSALRKGRRPS